MNLPIWDKVAVPTEENVVAMFRLPEVHGGIRVVRSDHQIRILVGIQIQSSVDGEAERVEVRLQFRGTYHLSSNREVIS